MGLARIKDPSNNEPGVRKTTKTTTKEGCASYAAPEQRGSEGTEIGRKTDVWSLAALTMEVIIWGFGGPKAWADFVQRREHCSKGFFHKDRLRKGGGAWGGGRAPNILSGEKVPQTNFQTH